LKRVSNVKFFFVLHTDFLHMRPPAQVGNAQYGAFWQYRNEFAQNIAVPAKPASISTKMMVRASPCR
jgi:hypothetical protein